MSKLQVFYNLLLILGGCICCFGSSLPLEEHHHHQLSTNSRIISQNDSIIDKYPYQAILSYHMDIIFCGGVILSPKHVLTSAVCVADSNLPDWEVHVGTAHLLNPSEGEPTGKRATNAAAAGDGFSSKIAKVYIHPKFNQWFPDSMAYSVAIVELQSEMSFNSHMQSIAVAQRATSTWKSTKGTVTGWGTLHLSGHHVPQRELQARRIPVRQSVADQEFLDAPLTKANIEDLGSPLVIKGKLHGMLVPADKFMDPTNATYKYFNLVLIEAFVKKVIPAGNSE